MYTHIAGGVLVQLHAHYNSLLTLFSSTLEDNSLIMFNTIRYVAL